MTIVDMLFSLLRSALWGEAFRGEVSKDEFAQVLKVAKEHGLGIRCAEGCEGRRCDQ